MPPAQAVDLYPMCSGTGYEIPDEGLYSCRRNQSKILRIKGWTPIEGIRTGGGYLTVVLHRWCCKNLVEGLSVVHYNQAAVSGASHREQSVMLHMRRQSVAELVRMIAHGRLEMTYACFGRHSDVLLAV